MRTTDYLDAARTRAGLPSDYALAKRLSVKPSAVSNWRNGRAVPEPLIAYHLAELSDIAPIRVLADLELERAERGHRDDAAAGWRDILAKIGGVAASFVVVAGLSAPSPSQAAPTQYPTKIVGDSLYIM